MNEDLITIIEKYYPKNVSAFDSAYGVTHETKALTGLKSKYDPRWPTFVDRMIMKFGREYVSERTDFEPGNRCVIYCHKNEFLFEIVMHISRMVEYFFFWVKKHFVDKQLLRTYVLGRETNNAFPEVETEVRYILQVVREIYNYQMMPAELAYTPVPYISTQNTQLGHVTICDLVFAGTDLSG